MYVRDTITFKIKHTRIILEDSIYFSIQDFSHQILNLDIPYFPKLYLRDFLNRLKVNLHSIRNTHFHTFFA